MSLEVVYLPYGLAFFVMATAVWVRIRPLREIPYAVAFRWLVAFGVLHGLYEWLQLPILSAWLGTAETISLFVGVVSYAAMMQFGLSVLKAGKGGSARLHWALPVLLLICWAALGWGRDPLLAETMARYLIGAPGIFLTAFALLRRTGAPARMSQPLRSLRPAGYALLAYGGLTLVTPEAQFFPASILNYEAFEATFGFSAQLARATAAIVAVAFIIRSLDEFDVAERDALAQRAARTEETIRDLNREKELILNAAGEGIYGLDLQGRTTFVNPAAARMIGWTPEELIGKPQHALMHHTKADGSPYPRELCPINAAFRDGKVHQVSDEVFWRKDGTSFPVEYVSTPIREDGELIGAVVVFTDITERKRIELALQESEERFRRSFEDAGVGVLMLGLDGRFQWVNRAFRDILGYSERELLDMTFSDVTHPDDLEIGLEVLREMVAGERQTAFLEKRYLHKAGHVVHVSLSASLIRDARGEPLHTIAHVQDISESKRAQAALQASEERFRDFAGASSDWFWEMDENLCFSYFSERFTSITGIAPDQLLGRRREESGVRNSVDPEAWTEHLDDLHNHRPFRNFEHQRTKPNGENVWLSISGSPVFDDGGAFKGYRGTGTDITERKRADRTEIRFRQAIETLSEGFALFDSDDRLVLCNDKYREIFPLIAELIQPGVRFKEMVRIAAERGQNFEALDDPEGWARRRLAAHALAEGTFEHQMADGRWLWAIEKKAADGYTMSTYIDITERKRAEDRLRDAMESIADGFILFDADDRVVMWNQRFADMYSELAPLLPAKPTAEELFRERYRVGAVGEFDVPIEEYVKWRMEMRQRQGGTPAVHRHADGRWFRTTERRTTEGGIVAISTDVSELKNSEMVLRQAKEHAEHATRAKSEFLANMSHELRTPLNAIIGFSEIMYQGIFGPVGNAKYLEYAKDINGSGQHLLDLINDILDLSKIEAGKAELHEQEIDIPRVVDSCLNLVMERSERGGLELRCELPEGLPSLRADERKLKQILLNLLSNAVKFTPAGGTVALTASMEPGEGLSIRVSDTGIGMAAEDIAMALEPFGQVEGSLTRRHEGTGLGLSLTKALVELHGGVFELESEPGVGTTATVRFPAERMRERAA